MGIKKRKHRPLRYRRARAVWDRDVSHRRSPSAVRAPHRVLHRVHESLGVDHGCEGSRVGLDAGEVLTIDVPAPPRGSASGFESTRSCVPLSGAIPSSRLAGGVVGGTYLSVRPGSSQAPQADALATIPSAEPTELSALLTSTRDFSTM